MLLALKKPNKNKKTTTKESKTATTYNNPCLHHRWICYQAIALNDQQVRSTSLPNLQPSRTSMTDHFSKTSQRLIIVNYFRNKAPSQMFL